MLNELKFVSIDMNLLELLGIKDKVLGELDSLRQRLTDELSAKAEDNTIIKMTRDADPTSIHTLEYNIESISLVDIISNINSEKKFFWKNAIGNFTAIGVGSIDCFGSGYDGLRFYAARFDSEAEIAEEWKDFSNAIDIVPQWGITQSDSQVLFINIDKSLKNFEKEAFLALFDIEEHREDDRLIAHELEFTPDYDAWSKGIGRAIECFASGEARKIVLARRAEMNLPECKRPESILTKLYYSSENSYCWYYQIAQSVAFVGASPEKLFEKRDEKITVDGLAGTIRRDTEEQIDNELAAQLLNSSKDLHEHGVVVEYITEQLRRLCDDVEFASTPTVKKLRTVQHLFTPIQGKLQSRVNWNDILEELHPTPAVGGSPKAIAMQLIREIEGYDRGLYAGPIGVVVGGDAEFAVGIRSGLFNNGKLYLYSGAGIVPDSNPQEEWQEINNKQKNFLSIFESNNE